tara:strand:+ start:2518 stop:2727 length:210 start_codon:yes stop_codon:yes gene_type:complete
MDEDNKVLTEALNLLVGFCSMGDILMAWDKRNLDTDSLIRVIDILAEHQDSTDYTLMDRRLNQIVNLYG